MYSPLSYSFRLLGIYIYFVVFYQFMLAKFQYKPNIIVAQIKVKEQCMRFLMRTNHPVIHICILLFICNKAAEASLLLQKCLFSLAYRAYSIIKITALSIIMTNSLNCAAADVIEIELGIRSHQFEPTIITAPHGKKIKLKITNYDDQIEEFESIDLVREKIIPPGKTATVTLPPLKPGTYSFYGEFHRESAAGNLIVE